ncbi:unnamed protein product [Ectocarpus sp. 6 AP-2014]
MDTAPRPSLNSNPQTPRAAGGVEAGGVDEGVSCVCVQKIVGASGKKGMHPPPSNQIFCARGGTSSCHCCAEHPLSLSAAV